MLTVKIIYDDNDVITIKSQDDTDDITHVEQYHDNSNPYDMCECLEDFIRLHIEERD